MELLCSLYLLDLFHFHNYCEIDCNVVWKYTHYRKLQHKKGEKKNLKFFKFPITSLQWFLFGLWQSKVSFCYFYWCFISEKNIKSFFFCFVCFVWFAEEQLTWCRSMLPLFQCFQTGFYLFKVNNRKTKTMFEICWKLTIRTPQRRHWRRSGVFIVNFEPISHIVLVFPLLILNK